jgi:serine protease Do
MMSTRKTTLFYAVLIATASLAVGMVIASQWGLPAASTAQTINVPSTNSAPLDGPIDAQTFRNIAKDQIPTVVNIRTEARARTQELTEFFGGGGDDLLRRFFGQPQAPGQGRRPRAPREEDLPRSEGAGSGFVIDKAGFILTNNHVVEGAEKIRVALYGGGRGEEYDAKVVGRDILTDSALIQLTEMPTEPLQAVKFGDSAQMQPGDWVMAIGNPFSLSHTVTVGVISALGRPFGVPGREQNMLQTDAAINPGNSGGPLLNIRGEVVGMNTAIYTQSSTAGNMGIGFATPINAIRDLLPQLRTGKVTRGVIGVNVDRDHLSKEAAAALGLPNTNGAVIRSVTEGEPAQKAGIQAGDVVVEINGKPVTDSDSLVSLVVATRPATTVPVTVIRDKKRMTLNVTVGELDIDAEQGRLSRRGGGGGPDEPAATGFGMDVGPVTPEIARELDLPRGRGGAIITDIDPRSPASLAGLAVNDVILEVNRQPVTNVSQVTRELQRATAGTPVFLLIWRDGQQIFVTMTKR